MKRRRGPLLILILGFIAAACRSVPPVPHDLALPDPIPLRYPVILVHGINANDRDPNLDSWGRIPETLGQRGIPVFRGNTDAWGTIESNAELLKTAIEQALAETHTEKVNIIAHSKGGIDARYCVWFYDLGERVASVTTIATPHRGWEMADLWYEGKIIHTNLGKGALKLFGSLYGDQNPNVYVLLGQLTSDAMRTFNETVLPDSRVYYQSLYTVIDRGSGTRTSIYRYVQKQSGRNDGMVSEQSARWGNWRELPFTLSHTEITDKKKQDVDGIAIPAIYAAIAEDLYKRGF
jgi:triacylglycerol lipase